MNKPLIAAFLAVLSTGCVLYAPGYEVDETFYPGDVTFSWTLAGQYCSDDPDVKSIHIQIPGEYLENEGIFPCSAQGFQGIVLHDFNPGTYAYTVDALDYASSSLYAGTGSFTVNGDVRVTVDLTPYGSPASYAYLSWAFPANTETDYPNCEQAGVAYVDVSLDGARAVRYDCRNGFGVAQAQTEYVSAGSHSIRLVAKSADGYPYYSYTGTLNTFANAPISAEYSLNWAVGGVAIDWALMSGGTEKTCTTAGVQTMTLNFEDSSGNLVYGPTGDVQACDAAPVVYNYLLPGTYRVFLQGTGPGGTFLSDTRYPVTVTVRAGQFVTEANAAVVPLYKR